ncbi:MAG: DUF4446 family protein [Actinobacteria bacterium]|nr:DUF4446 family protein [Actinomycetota bacterium]
MELSIKTLSILVLVSLGLNVVLFALLAVSGGRGRQAPERKATDLDETIRGALEGQGRAIKRLDQAIRRLAGHDLALGQRIEGAVQRVGLIRYDAFAEMGGRLSFSCALLSDLGDGVVITSINGRQDTRVYAKPVREGRSTHNLSDEEEQAIQQALAGPREAVTAR